MLASGFQLNEKGGGIASAARSVTSSLRRSLLHRRRDVVEGRLEAGADALHGGDGGNRDQRGDQAIFNGGGASAASDQLTYELHFRSPRFPLARGGFGALSDAAPGERD